MYGHIEGHLKQFLKAVYRVSVSSAEIRRASKTGFETSVVHHLTLMALMVSVYLLVAGAEQTLKAKFESRLAYFTFKC
jgi:hypothetical protein